MGGYESVVTIVVDLFKQATKTNLIDFIDPCETESNQRRNTKQTFTKITIEIFL